MEFVMLALDTIMLKGKVKVQPFHARSYLGNDCHRYFEHKTYEQCISHIVNTVRQLTTDVGIIDFAEDIKKQLDSTNDAYRVMHEKLGHSEPLKENDILAIDTLVNN